MIDWHITVNTTQFEDGVSGAITPETIYQSFKQRLLDEVVAEKTMIIPEDTATHETTVFPYYYPLVDKQKADEEAKQR